jgi:hypothetical protein
MKVAEEIGRLGFRRWYERQLIVSHGYLVVAFLALIVLLAGIEGMDSLRRSAGFYLLVVVGAAAAGTLMFVAWRRFNVLLARAELFAERAECPHCKAWGKFQVIAAERTEDDDPPEAGRPHWLRVRCRLCGTDWDLG